MIQNKQILLTRMSVTIFIGVLIALLLILALVATLSLISNLNASFGSHYALIAVERHQVLYALNFIK
ncbi:MAG: hypothetical protein KDJ52_26790 [Anaerolineae bacterium]|nr:hypothetical protein [Anaerolineae bacterium]